MLLLLGSLTFWGCAANSNHPKLNSSAAVGQNTLSPENRITAKPSVIYVTDFYLDPAQIRQDKSILRREGRIAKRLKRLRRGDDPATKAAKLIRTLSETITKELKQAGQPAKYCPNAFGLRSEFFPADASLPKEGWLVGGWFTRVDEGNRLVKTAVGFGTGAVTVKIQVFVSDLAQNATEPFLFIGTDSKSSRMPGGLVTKNPYVMAVKYVMTKGATEKEIKKQACSIANNLMEYIRSSSDDSCS
jgi:hypothetical protein